MLAHTIAVSRSGLIVTTFALPPIALATASIMYPSTVVEYLFTLVDCLLGISLLWLIAFQRSRRPKSYDQSFALPHDLENNDTYFSSLPPMSPRDANGYADPSHMRSPVLPRIPEENENIPDYLKFIRAKTTPKPNPVNASALLTSPQLPFSPLTPGNNYQPLRESRFSGSEFDDLIMELKHIDKTPKQFALPGKPILQTPNTSVAPLQQQQYGHSQNQTNAPKVTPADRVKTIFAEDGDTSSSTDPAADRARQMQSSSVHPSQIVPSFTTPQITFPAPPEDDDDEDNEMSPQLSDAQDDSDIVHNALRRSMRRVSIADTHL